MDNEWMSVKDEVPAGGARVLVAVLNAPYKPYVSVAEFSGHHTMQASDEADIGEMNCRCGSCDGEYCAPGLWFEVSSRDEETCWQRTDVTHWMPLPDPPTEVR